MKAEVILPLVAMILQAGVLLRQGDMLHRQRDLISEIAANRRGHEDGLSAQVLKLTRSKRRQRQKRTHQSLSQEKHPSVRTWARQRR